MIAPLRPLYALVLEACRTTLGSVWQEAGASTTVADSAIAGGLVTSRRELRQCVQNRAVKMNGEVLMVEDLGRVVETMKQPDLYCSVFVLAIKNRRCVVGVY